MLTILVVLVVDKFLPKIITLGESVIIVDTKDMEDFPSGQRERTVNPLLYVSMVRIHHLPLDDLVAMEQSSKTIKYHRGTVLASN